MNWEPMLVNERWQECCPAHTPCQGHVKMLAEMPPIEELDAEIHRLVERITDSFRSELARMM